MRIVFDKVQGRRGTDTSQSNATLSAVAAGASTDKGDSKTTMSTGLHTDDINMQSTFLAAI